MVLISVLLIIILVTLSSLRRYESLVASWLTINQRKMKSTPATWMRVKLRLRMSLVTSMKMRMEMKIKPR